MDACCCTSVKEYFAKPNTCHMYLHTLLTPAKLKSPHTKPATCSILIRKLNKHDYTAIIQQMLRTSLRCLAAKRAAAYNAASRKFPPAITDKNIVFPTPFVSGDYGFGAQPYTLIEQRLMMGLGAIKEKPQWWLKASDAAIAKRWRAELVAAYVAYLKEAREWAFLGIDADVADDTKSGRVGVAEHWATAVLDEIAEAAASVVTVPGAAKKPSLTFAPGPVDGTWLSDDAVSAALRARLLELIKPLEHPIDRFTGQPAPRDYHPGSDGQVVDLVHPSLYPLVFGRSLVMPVEEGEESTTAWKATIGTGTPQPCVFERPKKKKNYWECSAEFHSYRFQWLPSEIDLIRGAAKEGASLTARFRSYINNLHPEEHTELYRTLEEVFATAFAPLFTKVLTELAVAKEKPRRHDAPMEEEDLYGKCPTPEPGDDASEAAKDAYYTAYDDWIEVRTPTIDPRIRTPEAANSSKSGPTINLDNTRLQVIVKLASIELTPEKPSYGGGSWHVEGMENESIVASGIYYMASENVRGGEGANVKPTAAGSEKGKGKKNAAAVIAEEPIAAPTRLAFRTSVCEPPYEQSDDKGVAAVYGLVNEEALIQALGSVATTEGRCLAWPNTLQHQVQPFALADPTKPGHRKILVFFLVDPTKRIISTADVPPQQEEWALKERLAAAKPAPKKLPPNASKEAIAKALGFSWHFSHADALAVREELMAERKVFVDETMKETYEREFSLCEH